MSEEPVRVLALWSPDWPVTAAARAAHVPAHRPAAVFVANRVLACSAVARAQGIRRGLRRREAQARCPDLAVLTPDPDRDARAFEPVVAAVEELAPGVEVVRPGLVALPARGPVGYFGRERACERTIQRRERACERTVQRRERACERAAGENGELVAAERLVDQVAARTGVECQVGLADGLFAAVLAARRGVAVGPGDTPAFLAPLDVEELDREPDVDRSELVGLLHRLGLRSLGAFGALDPQDVGSRFGADAVLAHRLARGLDPRPPVRRHPPEELTVELELDPPVDRVDAAAFAARGLAERLHRTLAGHGLSCTRLGVAARTVTGEQLSRVWRCAEPLTPAGTVDRVRWQLDSWLTRGGSGAVDRLWLVPEETVTAGALQLGLWGEVGEADERAGRALVRVQALLGPEAVVTAVLVGGRDPAERVRLVPWGDAREGQGVELTAPDGATGRPPTPARARHVPAGTTPDADRDDPFAPQVPLERAPAGWPDDIVRSTGLLPTELSSTAAAPPAAAVDAVVAGSGSAAARDGAAAGSGSAVQLAAAGPGSATAASGAAAAGSGSAVAEAAAGVGAATVAVDAVVAGSGSAAARDGAAAGSGSAVQLPAAGPGSPAAASGPAAAGSGSVVPAPSTGSAAGAGSAVASGSATAEMAAGVDAVVAGSGSAAARDAAAARPGPAAQLPAAGPDSATAASAVVPGAAATVRGGAQPRPTNRRRRPPSRRSTPRPPGREPPPPWPGRLPAPSPATVLVQPVPAELLDADDQPVRLAAPDLLAAPPAWLGVDGAAPGAVRGWAGPWPVWLRWWAGEVSPATRVQVLCADGVAYLLTFQEGRWWVSAVYD